MGCGGGWTEFGGSGIGFLYVGVGLWWYVCSGDVVVAFLDGGLGGGGRVCEDGCGCVCGVFGLVGGCLTIPSTLISSFLQGLSFEACNHGPNCCSSKRRESLLRSQWGQSFSLWVTWPHQ